MSVFDHPLFQSLLETPFISRIRRNHGLEHAALHILSERYPHLKMAGHSDTGGFWLLGNLPLEEIQSAVQEAQDRLAAGEYRLAVHQNCGTNLATAGTFAGLAGGLAMFGAGNRLRDKLERLPLAVSLATLALILSRPIGLLLQERVTTSGELEGLVVRGISVTNRGKIRAYRVVTQG